MRLRCRGSALALLFFAIALDLGKLEELEPDEACGDDGEQKQRRDVLASHQCPLLDISMYNPDTHAAIASCARCSTVNFIATEATSAFANLVKPSTPRGIS